MVHAGAVGITREAHLHVVLIAPGGANIRLPVGQGKAVIAVQSYNFV